MTNIRLDSLAQSVTLKISLHVLFDRNPFQLDNEVIVEIARTINFLWTESKLTNDPLCADRERLRRALGLIFPEVGSNARQNPLNLILPAYETLWRVALFCFIEVTFRYGARAEWKQVLNDFLADPTNARFENAGHVPVLYPQLISSTRRSGSIPQPNVSIANSTSPEKRTQRWWLPTSKLVIGTLPFGAVTLGSSSHLGGAILEIRLATLTCPLAAVLLFARPSRTSDLA